jgi:ASC-1-like (ASCH) protein
MGLYDEYFAAIKEGKKVIEVRLNDEKRRKIKIGDTIEFVQVPDAIQTLEAEVIGLQVFSTFKEMYETVPFSDMGCEGWSMEDMVKGTYEIYSQEQENEWGALAIRIKP